VPLRMREVEIASENHVVQFYGDDAELVAGVAPYLAAAVRSGEVAVVIATAAHRHVFESALAAEGIDVGHAKASGGLLTRDAADTLARIVDHTGAIDAAAFRTEIGALVRAALQSGRPVRAYGEMVALLWGAGEVLGAIELERLWNELGRELSFSLFCSYHSDAVTATEDADALHRICHQHSVVLGRPRHGDQAVREPPLTLEAEFPEEPGAPGRARRLVAGRLRRWGVPDDTIDDAALIVSELASNAVRHAGSPFTICARLDDATLRLAVEDACALVAAVPAGGICPQPLHGLGVIDAISSDWGVEATAGGKVVWATLTL
jgi:hypothetical protein